jgi:hypothetical protein
LRHSLDASRSRAWNRIDYDAHQGTQGRGNLARRDAAARLYPATLPGIPSHRRRPAQHWLIGIQTFRILGSALLVRYFAGQLAGLFALPAGIGDVTAGLLAPFVAYAWYRGKPYARGAAIAWNVFGMADLINAVALGTLTGGGGGGIVFPIVLIPAYGVPRAFLIHSYSLIGLLRRTSQQPRRVESLHYGIDAARA